MTKQTGYLIISIPKSGLFYKDGKFVDGFNQPMNVPNVNVFSRNTDAQKISSNLQEKWQEGYDFPVVPVEVINR